MKTRTSVFTIILLTCLVSVAFAAPQKVNFQGKLTNAAGAPVNGSVSMTFRIYDVASGGTALWTETQTVAVTNGIYNVLLGKNNPIDTELTETKPLWLGVKVGADAEMSPRVELTPGLYDLIILNTITVKNGKVGIGTTTPGARLDIRGISGASPIDMHWSGTHVRHFDTNGNQRMYEYYDATNNQYRYVSTSGSGTAIAMSLNSGNVGIGTNNPDKKLEVYESYSGGKYIAQFTKADSGPGYLGLNGGNGGGRTYLQFDSGFFGIYSSNNAQTSWYHLTINGNTGNTEISGTLHVTGADLAEPFDMTNIDSLELGDVVVIDPLNPLHVTKSTTAYDTTVAGIVSSTTQAGYVAGSRSDGSSDKPIALVGRVLCNVSTENGAIKIGDLLTTSNTPGYAMKATDFEKRQGSILGKALQAFEEGRGQILVLVTLQ